MDRLANLQQLFGLQTFEPFLNQEASTGNIKHNQIQIGFKLT